MAYSEPRDWSDNDRITATVMNDDIRDQQKGLKDLIDRVAVYVTERYSVSQVGARSVPAASVLANDVAEDISSELSATMRLSSGRALILLLGSFDPPTGRTQGVHYGIELGVSVSGVDHWGGVSSLYIGSSNLYDGPYLTQTWYVVTGIAVGDHSVKARWRFPDAGRPGSFSLGRMCVLTI